MVNEQINQTKNESSNTIYTLPWPGMMQRQMTYTSLEEKLKTCHHGLTE